MTRDLLTLSSEDPAGWGPVLTVGGDVTTAIPDPVTGVSVVSTSQTDTATVQAISQAIFIPPAPTWSPIIDSAGGMTAAWVTWFQTLTRKLGGYNATPADDAYLMSDEVMVDVFSRQAVTDLQLGLSDVPSVRLVPDTDAWTGVDLGPVVQKLMAQMDELTVQVQAIADRGWNRQAAQPATVAAAPAGGTGTAAGGWDTAINRDTAITLINNLKTRLDALEIKLQTARILT